MKSRIALLPAIGGLLLLFLLTAFTTPPWGFWGHRRINRLAVFTVPPPLIAFYKGHIEYITTHAVDPDKRRYATKHEGVRHYMDLDHWGQAPFEAMPRRWSAALVRWTHYKQITQEGDTIWWQPKGMQQDSSAFTFEAAGQSWQMDSKAYQNFFKAEVLPQYYEEEWRVEEAAFSTLFDTTFSGSEIIAVDSLSMHGVLPFNLVRVQRQLTAAFRQKDIARILRLSADIGHYIGDAHVPLHTTKNYNGQLTNQVGIHAFWESRLPELFADTQYDFFVGKAQYIDDPSAFYWQIVLDSHALVDSVLRIDKVLNRTFSESEQYCFEERNGLNVRTQCSAYAAAYHEALDGMVERRMRSAIRAIGSAWYTAWVDGGQPVLSEGAEPVSSSLPNFDKKSESVRARPHE
ncbi:MAG: zinc dependent phospholipase C family protein [Bacteroidota bacterium]